MRKKNINVSHLSFHCLVPWMTKHIVWKIIDFYLPAELLNNRYQQVILEIHPYIISAIRTSLGTFHLLVNIFSEW